MTTNFLQDLEAGLEAAAIKFEDEIKQIASEVAPIALQYGEEFIKALGEIALGAVLKQIPLLISGTEKFGIAVTSVVQQVEAQGKPIAIQDAQLAVQAAYNKVGAVVSR